MKFENKLERGRGGPTFKKYPHYVSSVFVSSTLERFFLPKKSCSAVGIYFDASTFFKGPIPASFSVYFRLFNMLQNKPKFKLIKALIVSLGFKPGAAGWKAQMNPLSYGGTHYSL